MQNSLETLMLQEDYLYLINKQQIESFINPIKGDLHIFALIDPYFQKNMQGLKVIKDIYIGLLLDDEKRIYNPTTLLYYSIRKALVDLVLNNDVTNTIKEKVKGNYKLAFLAAILLFNYFASHYKKFEIEFNDLLQNKFLNYLKNGDVKEIFKEQFTELAPYPKEVVKIQAKAVKFITNIGLIEKAEINTYFFSVKRKIEAIDNIKKRYEFLQ